MPARLGGIQTPLRCARNPPRGPGHRSRISASGAVPSSLTRASSLVVRAAIRGLVIGMCEGIPRGSHPPGGGVTPLPWWCDTIQSCPRKSYTHSLLCRSVSETSPTICVCVPHRTAWPTRRRDDACVTKMKWPPIPLNCVSPRLAVLWLATYI